MISEITPIVKPESSSLVMASSGRSQRAPTLYFIIALKLGKGLLFSLLALGAYSVAGDNLGVALERLVHWASVDPESGFAVWLDGWLAEVTPSSVRWIASGSLLYGLLSGLEGVGLIYRLPWVGWVVISESALLIPYEVFKAATDVSIAIALILGINVTVVWYLVLNRRRLFRYHHR